MNIHFTSEEQFQSLLDATYVQIEVGSFLYGLKDSQSDTDLLCIYSPSDLELNSFAINHHQLQYKKDNVDYIFTTVHNLIRNVVNGDSTMGFEAINSSQLVGTPLEFLYDLKYLFNTYNVCKAYLGFAKRDLKHINKAKDKREQYKRLQHVYRGSQAAKNVFSACYLNEMRPERISKCKEIAIYAHEFTQRQYYIDALSKDVKDLREFITGEFEKGNINRFMSPTGQAMLDGQLNTLVKSDKYKSHKCKYFNVAMELIYRANEEGVIYEN